MRFSSSISSDTVSDFVKSLFEPEDMPLSKQTMWGRAWQPDGTLGPWRKIWYVTRYITELKKNLPFVRCST